MALLQCRECGQEIDSDTRQTRCQSCGALFPFTCAVCERPLRPPFPVYSDERYLTGENEPLCQQHFQRQCPRCAQWFQADLNPGFFLCPECSAANAALVTPAATATRTTATRTATTRTARQAAQATVTADGADEIESIVRAEERGERPLIGLFNVFVWVLIVLLLFLLGRQLIEFLAPLIYGAA
jgi:Zn finger protein HypA/HybF involved in hydrogenase expression